MANLEGKTKRKSSTLSDHILSQDNIHFSSLLPALSNEAPEPCRKLIGGEVAKMAAREVVECPPPPPGTSGPSLPLQATSI
jgi:hypothetical protein